MDKYYYIISQLPSLFFGKETEITVETFLVEAEKWMAAKDFQILESIDLKNYLFDKRDPLTLREYKDFENQVRTDIARFREAQKKDLDYKPTAFPAALIKEGNPLEIEIKLLELRWKTLDEMEREHHFDLGFLILYYLKLQITRRYFQFNKEEGLKKFQMLYEVAK